MVNTKINENQVGVITKNDKALTAKRELGKKPTRRVGEKLLNGYKDKLNEKLRSQSRVSKNDRYYYNELAGGLSFFPFDPIPLLKFIRESTFDDSKIDKDKIQKMCQCFGYDYVDKDLKIDKIIKAKHDRANLNKKKDHYRKRVQEKPKISVHRH